MRHSLAQLLAPSSREGSAAACSFPSEAPSSGDDGRDSPGEAGNEAEPCHEGAVAAADQRGQGDQDDDDDDELLFPAGLELDDWLEAAVAHTRPDWDLRSDGEGHSRSSPANAASEEPEPPPPPSSKQGPRRPSGSHRLKAAAAARLNRQKKKQYVLGLESRLQGLAAENRQLRDRNRGLCRRLRDLERETGYLRAVLANQSALGRLLSRLAGDGAGRVGLRIRTSLFGGEQQQQHQHHQQHHPARTASAPAETRLQAWEKSGGIIATTTTTSSSSSDHDYALPALEEEEEEKRALSASPGGICLHVDRDQVSVEFCSVCARRAALAALPPAASPPSFAAKIFSFRCLPCQAPLCRG